MFLASATAGGRGGTRTAGRSLASMVLGGTMLVLLVVLALALVSGVTATGGDPGAPSGSGVQPVWVEDNPSCQYLGFSLGFKVDPPTSGTYTFPDGINTVTVTSDGTYFDWTSTLGLDAVIAKGGPNANLYVYDPESFGDTGLHSPINQNTKMPYGLSHIEFCYDYELDVDKTADTTFTRTYAWTIDKSVTPEAWDLFVGDSGTSQYLVAVEKTGYTDSDWAVSGTITIENHTPFDATITGVTDAVSGVGGADVSCGVTFSYVLPEGETLECTYSADLPDGNSRINTATVATTGEVGGGEATADVVFGEPTKVVNDTIDVDDTNGGTWMFSGSGSAIYDKTFACESGAGSFDHDNIATIRQTGQSDDASVTVDCYELTVAKDALVSGYTQEYSWDIQKGPDGDYDMFWGDVQDHAYTIEVIRQGLAAEWAEVSGTITIGNPAPIPATIDTVSDVISGLGVDDVTADVGCGVTFPTVIPAGGSLTCTYSATVTSSAYDTNTATATLQNFEYAPDLTATAAGTTDFFGTADVVFEGVPAEILPVYVVDGDREFGPFYDSATDGYEVAFACDADEGGHVNTAYLLDSTGAVIDSASATVTVDCWALEVTKTADESLTRTWTWTIDKAADQSELTLSVGQQFLVNYEVTVAATSLDSDFAVEGAIDIHNPAPIPAMITGVIDEITAGDIEATVDCGLTFPYELAAGETLRCTYSSDLPDAAGRTNTATATLQNYWYAFGGAAAENGTTDFSGIAAIEFSEATVNEVDECIDVTDTYAGVLGTVCADQAPVTFIYSRYIGPYAECGYSTVENTASFVTNDTGATGSDSWIVYVDVPCDGCTLTPGYWKTHSEYGPAPYDETWLLVLPDGPDTVFFQSGQTYYEVLWTPSSGGNAYYILAHAYIAAELNQLDGASIPPEVLTAFDDATVLFQTHTPGYVSTLKGRSGNALRSEFISLAEILDDYNNGLLGPGHCTE